MSLGQWALTNPAGLLWGLLAVPIIALHILKPRRIQETVSAIFLWREVAKPVTAAKPWQNPHTELAAVCPGAGRSAAGPADGRPGAGSPRWPWPSTRSS